MNYIKYILAFAFFFVFFTGEIAFAWTESTENPTYDPIVSAEKAYFPSVLKMGAGDYRMWYQSNSTPGNSTIAYATSGDGLSWTLVTNAVTGLLSDNAGHPHIEFFDGKFRIWYWNVATPYGNIAMRYADSVDGIVWTNDGAITGNLITSASGQWNSGSYGAVDVLVNAGATNVGTNPFDYTYAMYYDATSGGYEQIALGYSANGISWTLYGTGPVLSKGLIGSWDSGYATVGTVIKNDSVWEMWYSGGVSASNEGIGYATSSDGLTWTKSAINPFMSKSNGVLWRNNRTYTPSVIRDGDMYKMWFTGKDNATGNYAIGYATEAVTVIPIVPSLPNTGSVQKATINVVKVVVNDGGGTKEVSDFPIFVNGALVVSGETNSFQAPADIFTVMEAYNPERYVQTFSGDCDENGEINLVPGDNKFCVVTNNDVNEPVSLPPIPPLIDVVKVPSPISLPSGPGPVTYTYTLRNIGLAPVTNITMIGDTCKPIVLVSGDADRDSKLDVDETWIYTCTTNLTETHTNTVTAIGWANGISTVDITSATVIVGTPIIPPLIHVTKVPSPIALVFGGGMVTYTNKVTNPGAVALDNIRLTDDKCSPVTYISGDTNGDKKLDPTEIWTFSCRMNLTKTTTNTIVAEGDAEGLTARDFAIVTVVVAQGTRLIPSFPNTGAPSVSTAFSQTMSANLGLTDRGAGVTDLQQFLIAQNIGSTAKNLGIVGATGYFGVLTRAALAEFQTNAGIHPPAGYFGPITREYIQANY